MGIESGDGGNQPDFGTEWEGALPPEQNDAIIIGSGVDATHAETRADRMGTSYSGGTNEGVNHGGLSQDWNLGDAYSSTEGYQYQYPPITLDENFGLFAAGGPIGPGETDDNTLYHIDVGTIIDQEGNQLGLFIDLNEGDGFGALGSVGVGKTHIEVDGDLLNPNFADIEGLAQDETNRVLGKYFGEAADHARIIEGEGVELPTDPNTDQTDEHQ